MRQERKEAKEGKHKETGQLLQLRVQGARERSGAGRGRIRPETGKRTQDRSVGGVLRMSAPRSSVSQGPRQHLVHCGEEEGDCRASVRTDGATQGHSYRHKQSRCIERNIRGGMD
jgi:hypothetical protein